MTLRTRPSLSSMAEVIVLVAHSRRGGILLRQEDGVSDLSVSLGG